MEKHIEFNTDLSDKESQDITKNYFSQLGFHLQDQNSSRLTFKSGNLFNNLVTFNPLKWKSNIEIKKENNKIIGHFKVSTFGQLMTPQEEELWNSLIQNFQACFNDDSDLAFKNFSADASYNIQ